MTARMPDMNFVTHQVKNVTTIMTGGGEGICSCEIDEHASGCAWIYNLEVEEAHRRKGIAGVLLHEVENLCSLQGVKTVSLSAKIGTFLIGWYERSGYRQICSDKDYVTMSKEL